MKHRGFLLLSAALVVPLCAQAGPVYKHVDAAGNVSYTDRPPSAEESAPLALPAAPSQAQLEQASDRMGRWREEANRMQQTREQAAEEPAESRPAVSEPSSDQIEKERSEGYYPTYGRLNPNAGRLPGRTSDHPIYKPAAPR